MIIISKTPLRISFFGGNTDFKEYYQKYGGLVLSTTIDKYIYCVVSKRFDDRIMINYSQKESVDRVEDIKHDLVREALKLLHITKGIEITFLSDIPSSGSGLGSSGAVTVGLLNALHGYLGRGVDPEQLAEEAIHIELDILKRPSGVQDQYSVAYGGLNAIQFMPSEVTIQKIVMSETVKEDFNNSMMLFYTGVSRETSSVLSHLDIQANIKQLDSNKDLANEAIVSLVKSDLHKFAQLLNVSWEAKKKLNKKTTSTHIDDMYARAMKAGAIGGKVIGAGGGGFMLVMFPANKRVRIRQALLNFKELPFKFSDNGSKIVLNI